uniref:Non-homologous end-joining factor 1 n=1 Tax=Astyanax mexicanus TaxID=7994 RepID=A0A8B9JEM1_ASTMX
MESMNHPELAVSALPWVPVTVGDMKLLAKAFFGDTEYRLLLSDLSNMWEEEMSKDSIQSRAQDLNKRLKAPVEAFFAHLRSVAAPCLSGQSHDQSTTAHFHLEHYGSHLTLKLKSELAGVPFYWEFRCTPAPVAVVSRQMMRPLLAVTRVLQKQVEELSALLVRKDAEIQDYKENGAVLSRGRLQTEPFDEETYRENFITQTLPQMGALQDCLEFDSELQELYVAVNSVRSNQKRKRSVSPSADNFSFVPEQISPNHDQGSAPAGQFIHYTLNCLSYFSARNPLMLLQHFHWLYCSAGLRPPVSSGSKQKNDQQSLEKTQEADSEQTVPLLPAAAPVDRSSVRPKKKKAVGLFR